MKCQFIKNYNTDASCLYEVSSSSLHQTIIQIKTSPHCHGSSRQQ